MSDRSKVDPVASGVRYVVTVVNGRPPVALHDFLAEAVVELTVESGGQVVVVQGSARDDGDSVVVYEKEGGGSGKDVRTWRVRQVDGRFEASEPSTY